MIFEPQDFLALALFFTSHFQASAACFHSDPLVAPSKNLKALIDVELDGMDGLGESPVANRKSNYPPLLSDASAKALANRTMRKGESGEVSYFEPAPNGGWRVCRVDLWIPKRADEHNRSMLEKAKRYSAGNDFLDRLVRQDRALAFSTTYSYDRKGRIERIEAADFSERSTSNFQAKHCRRYDDKDNVVLWVNPAGTNKCPVGAPSPRDEWRQFRYGQHNAEQVELLSRWHIPKGEARWKEQWEPFQLTPTPDSIRGHANVDSRRGVWEIFGSNFGKLDDNPANTVLDEFGRWKGSNYYFPKPPVPISILEKPEELYKHDRRRVTLLTSRTRLVELFKANEHVSRHRFYTLDGNVLRHEQLDEKGKVKRIITINDWRQPRPGPNPDFNDKLLTTSAPQLATHKIYHRVYDISTNGRPTLVAVSWDPSPRLPFKDAPITVSKLVFGMPDGKVKWNNPDEFFKAFDTSDSASQVYPDKQSTEVSED